MLIKYIKMETISLFTKNYLQKLKSVKSFNNNKCYKIYAIIDPIEESIFYIGCTKEEIHKRIYYHIKENTVNINKKISKNEKINELLYNEIEPRIEVLYFIEDKKIARIVEKYLINFCYNNFYNIDLLNRSNSFIVNPV